MEEEKSEKTPDQALTCIHDAYTLADTPDEADALIIKNFLNTLAEIALAIASRESSNSEDKQ